jgi:signal transduction histidine kinase
MTAVASPPVPARRPEGDDGPLARARAWLQDEPDVFTRPILGRSVADLGRAHPLAVDALIAFAVAVLSGPRLFTGHPGGGSLFLVLSVVPLVWRRQYPLEVFAFLCAVTGAQVFVLGNAMTVNAAGLVALYTVATLSPRRVALLAAAVAELGVLAASAVHGGTVARSMVFLTALVAAAFFLGTNIRTRRQYLAALVERAHRLEYERDQRAAMAVAAERASIAREMHDVVAHSLAVMITLADGAALKGRTEPDRATDAMRLVSETGRQALDETRRLVHVLRSERPGRPLAPQPGLPQLDALLEQVRGTGLRADLTVTGRPFPVPDGAQLAAYRIVQEALTNTLKHAHRASRAHVVVRYLDGVVALEVTDDGEPQPGAEPHAGHGIVGMRERAALYDGSVLAGPYGGGRSGWCVRARLHLAAARA